MLGPPADTPHVWIALSVASLAFVGYATSLPSVPRPDATGVADTVDAVAASPYPTTASHPVAASAIRLGSRRVAVRNDAGVAHATLAYGPVTPVEPDSRLGRVLTGASPGRVFDSPDAFRRALSRARDRAPTWQETDGRVLVRRLSWEGTDATLVGA